MRAARVRLTAPDGKPYGFPGNVAPSSAIEVLNDVEMPKISQPGDLLVQIKASTVYRDNLEWNELYPPSHAQLGNDFSGIVAAIHETETEFKVGDHVYGMTHAKRGSTWADFAVTTREETVKKPANLTWEEAAAIPGSAITADQALFLHAGLELNTKSPKQVLITGASGGVAMYMVRFAAAAGHHVVGATSSKARNETFLRSIGAQEVYEYCELPALSDRFDYVIDCAGSDVLRACWGVVRPKGTLVSFDACSWGYIDEHREDATSKGKEDVRALYFIAEPSRVSMARITEHVVNNNMKGLVLKTVPLENVREAYESVHQRGIGQGKIVVLI